MLKKTDDLVQDVVPKQSSPAQRIEHLPNFFSRCKEKVESPTIPRYEVLQCFIDSIKLLDTNGEVKQGVKELLGL